MMKKLDWYIVRKFLGTFFFSLSLIMAVSIVWDITEKMDDFINKKAPFTAIVVEYYLNFIPYFATMLSPLFIFIAVIYFTARMANNTEIVAILSAGVSFWRLLRPYFVASVFLALITYLALGWIVPHSNKIRLEFENRYLYNTFMFSERNYHRQIGKDEYFYLESYNNLQNTGFRFSYEKMKDRRLVYKLSSEIIHWDSVAGKWQLDNFTAHSFADSTESMRKGQKMDTTLAITPAEFQRRLETIETMDNAELDAFIATEKEKGSDNMDFYLVEKYGRLANPFSTFILTLIGVSLASRKVRGGIGLQIVFGLLLSFTYIFLMQISNTFALYGGFPAILAVWVPNIFFAVIATVILRYAPK